MVVLYVCGYRNVVIIGEESLAVDCLSHAKYDGIAADKITNVEAPRNPAHEDTPLREGEGRTLEACRP